MVYTGEQKLQQCSWDSNELDDVNTIKSLTILQMLVMFIVYTIMAYCSETKGKKTKEGLRAFQFVEEFIKEHFMYFVLALFVHTLVVRSWHLCLLGIYAIVIDVKAYAMQSESTKLLHFLFYIEFCAVAILTILIVTDDWCRFFLYRAHS